MPTIGTDTPPDELLALFQSMQNDGLIDYVLPTDPLGERWVVGMGGDLLNLSPGEAVAFLIGWQSTLHWLMDNLRAKGVGKPAWIGSV